MMSATMTPVAPGAANSPFSIPGARTIVHDLCKIEPAIYWTDLLLTLAVGYSCAALYMSSSAGSPAQLVSFVIAGFALFRAGSFIHEITHLRHGEMLAFQVFWNLVCGVPLLMPSFFYENHIDHHKSHHYGTLRDGEYLELGTRPVHHILLFLAQAPVLPVYIFLRFLLSPITFLHPALRQWALEHASSFVFNYRHQLTIPKTAPRRIWALLETACFLRCLILLVLLAVGVRDWVYVLEMYLLAVFVLSLNYNRNLVAHHYRNTGREMTHAEQLADSVNITGHWFWTELFFPLGLRYHALHHLFPMLPYHNLGRAHRRLMIQLPTRSAYRDTVYPSYWAALRVLWNDARAAGQAAHAPALPAN